MRKEVINVQFDNNPDGVFEAGQTVQGSVIISLEEKLNTEGIKVKCSGKARLNWTERSCSHYSRERYHKEERYHGDEILIKKHLGDSQEMPAGTHTFPFRFQLRKDAPASFKYKSRRAGVECKVYYHIKVVVVKPWFNTTFKMPFTVLNGLDLNVHPEAMTERRNSKQKHICCGSGPLSASVHVPRAGYVPGDTVVVYGEIENLSSRRSKCLVTLTQRYEFHVPAKTRKVDEILQKIEGPVIAPGEIYTCRESLTIPTGLNPSYLVGCNLMDIHYYAEVRAVPAGLAFNLKVPVEVVVGTVPHAAVAREAGTTARVFKGVPSSASSSSGLAEGAQWGGQGYDNLASDLTY